VPLNITRAENIAAELCVAQAVLDRLVAEDKVARDLLERRRVGVARVALQVPVAEAASLSEENTRRRGRALSAQGRSGDGGTCAGVVLPRAF
jgi:hypothetical protein